jgi:hypothetical protein
VNNAVDVKVHVGRTLWRFLAISARALTWAGDSGLPPEVWVPAGAGPARVRALVAEGLTVLVDSGKPATISSRSADTGLEAIELGDWRDNRQAFAIASVDAAAGRFARAARICRALRAHLQASVDRHDHHLLRDVEALLRSLELERRADDHGPRRSA